MSDPDDFITHDHDHVRIEPFRNKAQYVFPAQRRDPAVLTKDPVEHAVALVYQLEQSLGDLPPAGDDLRVPIGEHRLGANVEITTTAPQNDRRGPSKTPNLDFVAQNISVLRSLRAGDRTETSILFIPDSARNFLIERIRAYGARAIGNRKRPEVEKFEPIERISPAPAELLFVGPVDFAADDSRWWEMWVTKPEYVGAIEAFMKDAGCEVHADRLMFPETVVLFIYAAAGDLAFLLGKIPGLVSEVRQANGNILPFLELDGEVTQHDWAADLEGRIEVAEGELPAVCILDSGVSGKHPLISPALAGAWTVNEAWGSG